MPPRTRKPVKPANPLPAEGVEDALTVINEPELVIPPVLDDAERPIPAALQFTTGSGEDSADPEISDDDILEFSIDGHTCVAIKPTEEQWGVLMGMISGSSTMPERVFAMQQFASHTLDEESFHYVQRRLLDRTDEFGTEVYHKVLTAIIDHFSPKLNRTERRRVARNLHR
ncbi:hypothetical protein [Nocardia sp. NPDC004711]